MIIRHSVQSWKNQKNLKVQIRHPSFLFKKLIHCYDGLFNISFDYNANKIIS
jgi:hypothetical protein